MKHSRPASLSPMRASMEEEEEEETTLKAGTSTTVANSPQKQINPAQAPAASPQQQQPLIQHQPYKRSKSLHHGPITTPSAAASDTTQPLASGDGDRPPRRRYQRRCSATIHNLHNYAEQVQAQQGDLFSSSTTSSSSVNR